MTELRLTRPAKAAKLATMRGAKRFGQCLLPALPMVGAAAALLGASGCVSVKAPDKPIVIELNVNIRQEVVYRLAEDARETIKSNPEIF